MIFNEVYKWIEMAKVLVYYYERGQYNMLDRKMYQILCHQIDHIHEFWIFVF